MISIKNLPPQISAEVAQEFIEYRQAMGKRYALKTQGAFDRQIKIALRAHEVGMTPDELIMWTIDQNWQGINISYTKNRISQIIQAESNAMQTPTRGRTLAQDLTDTSWS
jgi:hypothetical protein